MFAAEFILWSSVLGSAVLFEQLIVRTSDYEIPLLSRKIIHMNAVNILSSYLRNIQFKIIFPPKPKSELAKLFVSPRPNCR
jgi:hypothetical protein